MRIVFIDGYNVINSWPNLIEAKNVSLESARQKLIDIMQNYAAYKGYKVIIVFDAHITKEYIEKKEKIGKVNIIFTRHGETADSYIERAVNGIGRKADVCVVTSDSLIQQLVFQRGAIRKSSREFYHEIDGINRDLRKSIKKPISSNKIMLEDFLEEDIYEKLNKIRRNS